MTRHLIQEDLNFLTYYYNAQERMFSEYICFAFYFVKRTYANLKYNKKR
jgi:hypothetical protein